MIILSVPWITQASIRVGRVPGSGRNVGVREDVDDSKALCHLVRDVSAGGCYPLY
jgi:hypothetical protein